MLNGEKLETFALRSGARQGWGCSLKPFLFNTVLEVLANATWQEKESVQDGKGRNKTAFVHRWHNCLCRRSERINKKLLELIINYSKCAGSKVNIQKSTVFLYTIRGQVEFEM